MTDTLVGEDPLLGVLRNNGGPTRTHALLTGSPAIDAGDTDLDTDQRGYARPSGLADDIGAFEEAQVGTITIVKQTPVQSIDDYNFTLDGDQLDGAHRRSRWIPVRTIWTERGNSPTGQCSANSRRATIR